MRISGGRVLGMRHGEVRARAVVGLLGEGEAAALLEGQVLPLDVPRLAPEDLAEAGCAEAEREIRIELPAVVAGWSSTAVRVMPSHWRPFGMYWPSATCPSRS